MIDNKRYFKKGGQAGIETKRGCPGKCIYCAEPAAKGDIVRTRSPADVTDEIAHLLQQGIDYFHTCDSEFNLPDRHAKDICKEILARNIGDKIRWYAYCSPLTFNRDLAELMKAAGCAGINFGVDNGDAAMLDILQRDFSPDDIENTARYCRQSGITTMFDLLLGREKPDKASRKQLL